MNPVAIPAWTGQGVLPPIHSTQPLAFERSPYPVSLTDSVLRFGTTPERRAVLSGLLRYRAALHALGLVSGFQWIDGSFLEHVEQIEGRSPNDVDVVTFFRLPAGRSQGDLAAAQPDLFAHAFVKATYLVDSYHVDLGMDSARLTERAAYWYSVWSHRRNGLWKGFLRLDLAPREDLTAGATLASLHPAGHP